jgi:hypothetical protein
MLFENHLTNSDFARAAKAEMTPRIITGANLSLLNAIESFWIEVIEPFVQEPPESAFRELAFITLSNRLFGYARTITKLNSLVYQQSVTSAERSILELWLDIRLLHQNYLPDGPERLFAFAEFQKLAAARRTDAFFRNNPVLDEVPSAAVHHRAFISKNETRIDAQTARLWPTKPGKRPRPQHWTNLTLEDRARAVGPEAQLQCIHGYDMRNFSVHTGVANMMNVPPSALELIFVQSVGNVVKCMQDTLLVLGEELKLRDAIPEYTSILEYFNDVPAHSATDAILRSQGEPQRYFFKDGPWSVRDLSGETGG